ncbi:hypothetical protein KSP40_PGU011557 [Platanthera guangdongensis]|uniref:Mon2/Sec7/BIG1-like dimerisation and cyclophilin-binding domain-containing protein n=1 Tax=Platanthera guangdongensis TaxID=2320717 RepID=A0ABR2LWE5_9ASPA
MQLWSPYPSSICVLLMLHSMEDDMTQALSICLRLLENNRSSDSVHNTAAATFRQAVALIFDNVVHAESLPSGKSESLRANTVTNNVSSSVGQSGSLEARNVSVQSIMKESLSKTGKLGLLLLEDLTALAAGGSVCAE